MKINITDEIRQEILDMLNRDTAKEYFEKLRDTEKNPTRGQVYAYRSWEQSTEDRADMFEVRALPWGSQIKDGVMKEFVAALTAADIDEIIVTDQSTALMESVHALVAEGAYLEGVGTVTRDPLHDHQAAARSKGWYSDFEKGAPTMKKLICSTFREGYGIDQIRRTMTAGELINFLAQYDEDTPVYLSFDNGYTYGGITEGRFEEDYGEED